MVGNQKVINRRLALKMGMGLSAFLVTSPLNTLTGGISKSKPIILNPFYPVVWTVARFAGQVALQFIVSVASAYAYDYLKSSNEVESFNKTNKNLEDKGYNDYSHSKVFSKYADLSSEKYSEKAFDDIVFYGVNHHNNNDFAVPFFNRLNEDDIFCGVLYAPEMAILTKLAETISGKRNKVEARSLLLPKRKFKSATGSLEKGYDEPIHFYTEKGEVEILYKTFDGVFGEARIRVIEGRELIHDYTFETKIEKN